MWPLLLQQGGDYYYGGFCWAWEGWEGGIVGGSYYQAHSYYYPAVDRYYYGGLCWAWKGWEGGVVGGSYYRVHYSFPYCLDLRCCYYYYDNLGYLVR